MAWTWTGYDHDAVHRFKEADFFQTGRNQAEANFWKNQIHGIGDRRGTQSSIALGAGSEGYGSGQGRYHRNSYSEPRERSNSVISTFSIRMKDFGPSRDYPYSYPGELSEEEPEVEEEVTEDKPEDKVEDIVNEEEKEIKVEDDKEETESKCCSCSHPPEAAKKDLKKVEKEVEKLAIKESPKVEEKNAKSHPMKTMIETKKFVLDDHISSRFY